MAISTITFDISSPEDELSLFRCLKAKNMAIAISSHLEYLRNRAKYQLCEKAEEHLEDFYKKLEENDIQIDKLIL